MFEELEKKNIPILHVRKLVIFLLRNINVIDQRLLFILQMIVQNEFVINSKRCQ